MTGSSSTNQSNGNYLVVIGNGTGTSASNRSNAFTIEANGDVNAARTYTSNNADFAEYFEWQDQNKDNEDRRGLFVTLEGNKIRIANENDQYILGAVTSTQAFIGNTYNDEWQGKYAVDIFGERLYQEIETIKEPLEEDKEPIIEISKQFIINPDYDSEQNYISRKDRKEWDPIWLCGQVILIDDGSCKINGYCRPSSTGIATNFSIEDIKEDIPTFMKEFYLQQKGYRVIERLDDTHIRIIIK